MTRHLPPLAVLLGLGGLVPFLACGYATVARTMPWDLGAALPPDRALFALVAYASVILSFLGAVHWGFALAEQPLPGSRRVLLPRLGGGVLPALLGWAALLVAVPGSRELVALAILAAGFVLVLAAEQRGVRAGLVPRFYLGLRFVLTFVVLAVLLGVLVMRATALRFGA